MKRYTGLIPVYGLMIAAPLAVIIGLAVICNIFAVFVAYHVVIALVLPLLDSLFLRRFTVKEHLRFIGLLPERPVPGIIAGVVCAVVMGGGTVIGFLLWGDFFLEHNDVVAAIGRWGVSSNAILYMMGFMVLYNGVGEELFWRGYVQRRLQDRYKPWVAILIATVFYTGYHPLTVYSFFGDIPVALFNTFMVFLAGLVWGWLRYRFDSAWPAMLGHIGATAGYMAIYWIRFIGN
ncbi:MAG: CPBP family intramembrane metalloprotease [bacterium]|nr:CPBP family intramembrane metalloprotease [bacterium]